MKKERARQNRVLFFFQGRKHEKTFYKITYPPKRAVAGIGPNAERGLT